MACDNLEQLLIEESGRIGSDIYRRTVDTSVWLKLTPQDTWPDEMGDTVSVLVYERTLPHTVDGSGKSQAMTWSAIASNDLVAGDSSSCVPAANRIAFGQTLRQYNLEQFALESPDVCLNDLRFPFKRKEQLSNLMDILTENTAWVWQERFRDEYIRLCQHKVIAKSGLPESSASFPEQEPTSKLTQSILDKIYMKLVRDGAGRNPMDRVQGKPVFMLITSPETSEDIIKLNDEIRQDFRWSTRVNELLAPLGIDRVYKGYFHACDAYGPRYDFDSGAAPGAKWVRRYPFVRTAATTKGYKWEIDTDYENALYEDSVIFHREVMTSLVPKPISGTGAMNFQAQNYRGDFQWRNILDRVCNPDGNIGYFRGIFGQGSKPVHPQFGFVIRHKRCPYDLELLDCTY